MRLNHFNDSVDMNSTRVGGMFGKLNGWEIKTSGGHRTKQWASTGQWTANNKLTISLYCRLLMALAQKGKG